MSNPVLSHVREHSGVERRGPVLTYDDVFIKTGISLAVVVAGGVATYAGINQGVIPFRLAFFLSAIAGFILALVAVFRRVPVGPVLALTYAAVEGVFVGSASYVFGNYYVGGANTGSIITIAVVSTISVFAAMLFLYQSKVVRVTKKFYRVIMGATLGLFFLFLINFGLQFLGVDLGFRGTGALGIIFSFVAIIVASLNLAIDFDQVESAVKRQAGSEVAWGLAFGLTVTLVWLYVEILRLVSIFSRD